MGNTESIAKSLRPVQERSKLEWHKYPACEEDRVRRSWVGNGGLGSSRIFLDTNGRKSALTYFSTKGHVTENLG